MINNSIKKKIVLLEFEDEVRAFLAYCGDHGILPSDFHIIAFQLEAQACLKKHNVAFENTLPYFSNESHKKLLLKSEEWYRFLAARVNISDGSDIKETYNNTFLFFTRFRVHCFLFYCELFNSIIEKNEIDGIFVFIYENELIDNFEAVTDNERYLGVIAEVFSRNRGITFNGMRFKRFIQESAKRPFFRESLFKVAGILDRIYGGILLSRLKTKKCVLLTTKSYNFRDIAIELKKHISGAEVVLASLADNVLFTRVFEILRKSEDRHILHLPLKSYQGRNSQIEHDLILLDNNLDELFKRFKGEWFEYFKYHNISFVDFFMPAFKKSIKIKLRDLCSMASALRRILNKANIKLIVSPFARDFSLLLGELGSNRGIPGLMISHGTVPKPKNDLEEVENRHLGESLMLAKFYDYTALQTPNEEKSFYYYNIPGKEAFRTGPLIFSKAEFSDKNRNIRNIIGILAPDTKVLLYPENTRLRSGIRFHVFETADEFLSSSIDLVNAVENVPGVHLVIRLHPGKRISPREFKTLLPLSDKVTVTSPVYSFEETLSICDLLVNFSSTVIEDALQNRIPVLLYDKWDRYSHFEASLLSAKGLNKPSGVYYVNDSSYLSKGLQWIMDNHLRKCPLPDVFDNYVYKDDYYFRFKEFIMEKLK